MECLPWENAMLKPLVCLCFDHTDADSALVFRKCLPDNNACIF